MSRRQAGRGRRATYAQVCDALGDPTRRDILERLRRRPSSVGELAETLPVSRPAVSQHLRTLEEAGLVAHRPDGRRHVYHVDPDGLEPLRSWLDGFWQDVLESFAEHVREQTTDESNTRRRAAD